MATADQMKALVKSHAEGDDDRFYSVALQVAARASRSGHGRFAQELRDLVDSLQSHQKNTGKRAAITPMVQPRGELSSLLSVTFPELRLSDLSLSKEVLTILKSILREHKSRQTLSAHGFRPVTRVLLVGPPGTGKTSSAAAMAGELSLPLFTVRLEGLISKYMGESAAKLRLVFDAIEETKGVYFFDEVDALAGDRSAGNDVGEIRRVLNSFLQFLEGTQTESLLMAATNHPSILDDAVFRRFESILHYPLPDPDIVISVIRNRLSLVNTSQVSWDRVVASSRNLSHAELTIAAETAAKKSILLGRAFVTTEDLETALSDRRRNASVP